MKRLSDRAFAKGDAPTMAWCMPGIIRITGMLHQRPKERWQQTVQIASGRPSDLPRQERHGVFKQIEQPPQLIQIRHGLGRRILDGDLLAKRKNRQLRCAPPGNPYQAHHILQ